MHLKVHNYICNLYLKILSYLVIYQNLTNHLNNPIDIIIITTGHSLYSSQETIDSIYQLPLSKFIYDTIGLLSDNQINILKEKHTIKILGRGDL